MDENRFISVKCYMSNTFQYAIQITPGRRLKRLHMFGRSETKRLRGDEGLSTQEGRDENSADNEVRNEILRVLN